MSFKISGGAQSLLSGTVRGTMIPWSSLCQPYFVGSILGGNSSSAAFRVATWRWHLSTFSKNESLVGGREQSFNEDVPLFAVFVRHILILQSVLDVHDSVAFPYAGIDELGGLKLNTFRLAFSSPIDEMEQECFCCCFESWCLAYNSWAATMSVIEMPCTARRSPATLWCSSAIALITIMMSRSFTRDDMNMIIGAELFPMHCVW